ncbi:MAG: hypothetical protein ABEJ85_03155 [Haloarculaceae archaeon]
MATTSHRTTSHGTLYAVECRECAATGGVRRDGATFGAVAALEDVDDIETEAGPAPGDGPDDDAPVTCDGCGRDRRLRPVYRSADDTVLWVCPTCAEQAGGSDE